MKIETTEEVQRAITRSYIKWSLILLELGPTWASNWNYTSGLDFWAFLSINLLLYAVDCLSREEKTTQEAGQRTRNKSCLDYASSLLALLFYDKTKGTPNRSRIIALFLLMIKRKRKLGLFERSQVCSSPYHSSSGLLRLLEWKQEICNHTIYQKEVFAKASILSVIIRKLFAHKGSPE